MPLSRVSKLYAVKDAKIGKVTADPAGGSTTYAALVDVPGIKEVTIGGDISTSELRGDNTLLDSNSTLTNVTVGFGYAKLQMDTLAVWLGGAIADAGVTPNQKVTYSMTNNDTFQYWKFEAVTPTGGADSVTGDAHILLYKCILSEFPEFGFAEEDYQDLSASANAVPRLSDGKWMDIVLNESADRDYLSIKGEGPWEFQGPSPSIGGIPTGGLMNDSDRILARGAPITLADGRIAHLRFGMLGLKQLEDEFGSLAELQKAIGRDFQLDEQGAPTGKALRLAWTIMKAGLIDLQMSELELDQLIDFSNFGEYTQAFGEAFDQAFGRAGPKGEGLKEEAPQNSPGATSITSLPSPSKEPIAASGV